MNNQTIYSNNFNAVIKEIATKDATAIIVVIGDYSLIKVDNNIATVIDIDTFASTGGSDVFDKAKCKFLYKELCANEGKVCVLSLPQYTYLTKYYSTDLLDGHIYFVRDNLRSFFPLQVGDFIHDTQVDDNDNVVLPDYQADQYAIEGKYFYSNNEPDSWMSGVYEVFKNECTIESATSEVIHQKIINPFNDNLDVDILLDEVISGAVRSEVLIKKYDKLSVSQKDILTLNRLNSFLTECGCKLYYSIDEPLEEVYTPSSMLMSLLRRYWGDNASFRDIKIYKNPDVDSTTVSMSQARIVQTLIDEYENARSGKEFRDVFLTAPTGAGKSLLFQLPAFYISERGDFTIVISPLIALMKDQVAAITGKRGFEKAAYLNSEISMNDRDAIILKCQQGEIDVLYMAPELLLSYDISFFIGNRKIGLLVVDEAHTVTTWGRDFRVDYWYLGNHIRKIRKYKDQRFPMIAVTATAVYGGASNDMVFDTVDSLAMHNPHYFIGEVKRDDIEFIINNYDSKSKGFDSYKVKQTSEFVKEVNTLGFKTLVYAPYTNHVNKIAAQVNSPADIAAKYFGSMGALDKEQNEAAFRASVKKTMICTKAFGMGVDIPDIQVVYHHAPSGILPDYIQEIGRAARDPQMKGYAVINYSEKDQRYSKTLVGMSSIKLFQIKAILKKIYDTYVTNGNKRNMLLSVEDFAYAFDDKDELETKVKTGLMMIEKDYLTKYQYNVVVARPKSLFGITYAKISKNDYGTFCNSYPGVSEVLSDRQNGDLIILLHLDALWKENFSDISFPLLKARFFHGKLVPGMSITPSIKITLKMPNISLILKEVAALFENLKQFFIATNGRYFIKDDLEAVLKVHYNDKSSKELVNFVLDFASTQGTTSFLQEKFDVPRKYRVMSQQYESVFASILKLISKLSLDLDKYNYVSRYVSKESATPFERIGHLLEILDLGNYEMRGGECPMIFIRVNNPNKVKYDSMSASYENILFKKTQTKHKISNEIFDHFFMHSFTNEERWNLIEDFFLGASNPDLIAKYPGSPVTKIDVIGILKNKNVIALNNTYEGNNQVGQLYFPPQTKYTYKLSDHLSYEIEGVIITQKISEWIKTNPVQLYKLVKNKSIFVDGKVFKTLMSSIGQNEPREYAKILGTRKKIQIPGMNEPEIASLVMTRDPEKFYKWWNKHREEVYIPLVEKIPFFVSIYNRDSSILLEKDKKLIKH